MKHDWNVVSLFSGIGGFEWGLERACPGRIAVKMACEWREDTRHAYALLHGQEPRGDVTKIDASDVPDHDLLVGGFPCQAFSIAGKREGFADTRGTLFFDVHRIVAQKRPKWVLLENVKNLLSHDKGRTLTVMLRALSDIGYAVDFTVMNSAFFGVPQRRERCFIVAKRDEEAGKWSLGPASVPLVQKRKAELAREASICPFSFPFPEGNPTKKRIRDVLTADVDQRDIMNKPFALSSAKMKDMGLRQVAVVDMKANDSIRRVYSVDGWCPTLTTMEGGHRQPKVLWDKEIRKLNPLECFRVQGFSDKAHDELEHAGFSRSQRYRFIGNAVTPHVVEAIMRVIDACEK